MLTTRARFARGEFTLRAGGVALRGRQQGESAGHAQRGRQRCRRKVCGGARQVSTDRKQLRTRGVKEVAGDTAGNVG